MIRSFFGVGLILVILKFNEAVEVSDKIDFNTENDKFSRLNKFKSFEHDFLPADFETKQPPNNKKIPCNDDPLTIVHNIQLDINENLVITQDNKQINNQICNLTVKTVKDKFGNLVTAIQFTLITKINEIKYNEIPVIDGVRGINDDNYQSNSINSQTHRRYNTNNFQPSLNPNNYFFRPQTDYYYYNNNNNNNNNGDDVGIGHTYHQESYGRKPWMTSRDTIDDKIEPPLSKTSLNDQH
ncbi:putative uncharacterized protein DDB_G0282499 [Microplitis mediator]|uniref:putative uncharacterized protein DDB_G0282499 n=1 Tax=Microplitis mediator TaxID=375433 RepID=UPI002555EF95|nr:putative uncharacterized protein DDB_G0282499 [Microplitis mediator]